MAKNNEIFLGSGANLTLVPEVDFYFKPQGTSQSAIQIETTNLGHLDLVNDMYVGCTLDWYDNGTYASSHIVTSNNIDTFTISPSTSAAVDASADYFILKGYGAPLPAPSVASSSGAISSATIDTAGTQIKASEAILDSDDINAVSGISGGSGAEIELTLTAHSSTLTFADSTASNYEVNATGNDGFITINIAGAIDRSVAVQFNDDSGSAGATGADVTYTVDTAASESGSQIAEAVKSILETNGENITITRALNVLTITNNVGGYVSNTAEDTNGGVTVSSNTAGGAISAVTVNAGGSSYSGTTHNATITSDGGSNGVVAITISNIPTALRLCADNWLGLVETATFPNLEVEMKQMNLALGGTRNYTYQYKGIETAQGGNIGVMATQPTWLYYALGKCSTLSFGETPASGTNPASYHTGSGVDNKVFVEPDGGTSHLADGPIFYRQIGGKMVPPLLPANAAATMDQLQSIDDTTDLITYTFTESNTDTLPSFALEHTLSKLPTSNTYYTDTDNIDESHNFVRVARGNKVNTLTLTANENEEVKITMDLSTRAVSTIPATTSYEARGGVATDTSLFNFNTNADSFNQPYFFSDGAISAYGQNFLKITNFTLTINNNLQDKRFVGIGSKGVKDAIPAQRTYEIALTAMVTDDKLFRELLNSSEESSQALSITFAKEGSSAETFTLSFSDYFTTANTWTVPEDKGPITVEATLMPRTLSSCTAATSWILMG